MSQAQILVVGAGPTGLVLALGLALRGVAVMVIDRDEGPARESRAMGVQARTLEFYRQLGFGDEVAASGIKVGTVHFLQSGKDIARFTLADMGEGLSPYPFLLCYPQDEHERFLVERLLAAGVEVEWKTTLTSLSDDGDAVRVVMDRSGIERTASFSYVVGCDGARSQVRASLDLGFPGGTYDQLFYVADVKVPGVDSRDVYAHLALDGITLMMPVRSSGMQRLIGLVPFHLRQRTDLAWADIRHQVEPLLGVTIDELNWFSTYRVHHRVAAAFRVGRVFIAGDAGHIHSPTGGQGMNTGIGDAINLSWKLAAIVARRANLDLLDTYESERIAFARSLVSTTDKAFQTMVGEGRGTEFLRTWFAPHLLSLMAGFSATRRMMFKTISQVRVSYRDSALSDGSAGGVEGGDRLPWVPCDGGDNFEPLRSLDWQLHIYGTASAATQATAARLGLQVHVFPWSDLAEKAGLKRDASYLVRPDGYVAMADPRQTAAKLDAYIGRWGLSFQVSPALDHHQPS